MSSAGRGRWRGWVGVVGVMVVALSCIYGRALLEARAQLLDGEALEATDLERAMRAYRHAVEWYAPGNPYSARAVEHLLRLGLQPIDDEGDEVAVLEALESLRTAVLVTRHMSTPYGRHLAIVERRIAELRGAQAAARTGQPLEDEVARQLGLLEASRQRAPNPGWSLVTAVAFVVWIAITWRGLQTAFESDGRLRRGRALRFAILSLAALATWVTGLTLV